MKCVEIDENSKRISHEVKKVEREMELREKQTKDMRERLQQHEK